MIGSRILISLLFFLGIYTETQAQLEIIYQQVCDGELPIGELLVNSDNPPVTITGSLNLELDESELGEAFTFSLGGAEFVSFQAFDNVGNSACYPPDCSQEFVYPCDIIAQCGYLLGDPTATAMCDATAIELSIEVFEQQLPTESIWYFEDQTYTGSFVSIPLDNTEPCSTEYSVNYVFVCEGNLVEEYDLNVYVPVTPTAELIENDPSSGNPNCLYELTSDCPEVVLSHNQGPGTSFELSPGATVEVEYYASNLQAEEQCATTTYTAVCDCSTTASDYPIEATFSLHPNPASGVFFIELDQAIQGAQIEMHNVLGQKIYDRISAPEDAMNIDVRNFPPGIYYVSVSETRSNRSSVRKLLVQ